ncbi:MAG: hypothetical protein MZV64_72295, partial [Ignavibacteriales bacterium]|nr:hypothetical protein [Ignavibacteriales bacterium]
MLPRALLRRASHAPVASRASATWTAAGAQRQPLREPVGCVIVEPIQGRGGEGTSRPPASSQVLESCVPVTRLTLAIRN